MAHALQMCDEMQHGCGIRPQVVSPLHARKAPLMQFYDIGCQGATQWQRGNGTVDVLYC